MSKVQAVEVEPVTAELTDCPEAMQFVDLKFIPTHQILKPFTGNNARLLGVTQEGISNFVNVMKRKRYRPFHYIPPVVEFIPKGDRRRLDDEGNDRYRYSLVAGDHRLEAHYIMGKPEFWAQVVEFVSARGKSANYWRKMYQIQENMEENEEYVRTYATEADIVHSLHSLVKEQTESQAVQQNIDDLVRSVIADAGFDAKGVTTRLFNLIMKKLGNTSKVVQGITKSSRQKYYRLHLDNTKKKMDYVLYQSFTAGGAEVEDYDYRGIAKVWNLVENDPKAVRHIHIVAGTTKSDYEEVPEVRKSKRTLFRNHANDIIRRVAYLMGVSVETLFSLKKGNNYEKFCEIGDRIFWIPQIGDENEIVKNTGSLIQVTSDEEVV